MNNYDYQNRLNEALKAEHKLVFNDSNQLLPDNSIFVDHCPVCNKSDLPIHFIKDGFNHCKCDDCGFLFINPRLNEESTFLFYNSAVNEIYNESKFHENADINTIDDQLNLKNFNIILQEVGLKRGNFLEIGPGRGAVVKAANSEGFNVSIIELNKSLIENLAPFCKEVFNEDVLSLNLKPDYYDVIYFRDVMEHIPDPIAFLKKINIILKPGGILFIDTHNIDSIINVITGKYHTVIFGFEHPVHWSPKTLKFACNNVGLSPVKTFFDEGELSLYNLIYYFAQPSFTYIYKPKRNRFINILTNLILTFLSFGLIKKIDLKIFKKLALILNRGSKMQLIFTKS